MVCRPDSRRATPPDERGRRSGLRGCRTVRLELAGAGEILEEEEQRILNSVRPSRGPRRLRPLGAADPPSAGAPAPAGCPTCWPARPGRPRTESGPHEAPRAAGLTREPRVRVEIG